MENSIANRNIGYDQLQNQTLWNQIKSKGYDPTRATTPCETDCARLVRVCVAYGFDQNGLDASTVPDWYTGTLPKLIMGLGEFVKYTDNKHCKGCLLYTSNAIVRRGGILQLGNFGFVPEEDGSLSFLKIGGE